MEHHCLRLRQGYRDNSKRFGLRSLWRLENLRITRVISSQKFFIQTTHFVSPVIISYTVFYHSNWLFKWAIKCIILEVMQYQIAKTNLKRPFSRWRHLTTTTRLRINCFFQIRQCRWGLNNNYSPKWRWLVREIFTELRSSEVNIHD